MRQAGCPARRCGAPAGGQPPHHRVAPGHLEAHRDVWFPEAGGVVSVPVYARDRLSPGNRIAGPAIVEQMDATTVILPGQDARVDAYDTLILEASA